MNTTTTITLASLNARDATIELVDDNKDVYRASVRTEVAKFAIEMETVLRKNDYKSGWYEMDYLTIFFRLRGEFNELKQAFDDCIDPQMQSKLEESIQDMRKEAIDIANFCMFLCHNYPETGEEQ